MKKVYLILPAAALCAYFTLSSNINGYPGNRTGSDGVSSTIGCGGSTCHGSASSSTIAAMGIVIDSAGTPVTHYTPGATYRVSMYGAAAATASLHKFGFQLSGVKSSDNSQAGTFVSASLPPEATISTFSGRQIVGHNTPKADSVVTLGSVYPVQVSWTAPAAGTGDVKFYGVINAVDNSTSASSADKWNTTSVTITELVDHTAVGTIDGKVQISIAPNPVISTLNLELTNVTAGHYSITIYDLTGKAVATETTIVTGNSSAATLNVANIAPGMYHVVVTHNGSRYVTPIVKQ